MFGNETLGLIFEIFADPGKAEEGLDHLQEKADSATSSMGSAFLALGTVAVAAGGALIAAGEKAALFAEEMEHAAERTGATTEQMSTLHFAADHTGVSFETLSRGVMIMSRNLGQIGSGGGKQAAAAFADLGIKVLDSHGHVRSMAEILPLVAERLANMASGSHKTADAVAIMGRGGMMTLPVWKEFREGLKAVEDQAASLGLVITDKDVVAGEMFLKEQRLLKAEMEGFTLHIGKMLLPTLIHLAVELEHGGDLWDDIKFRVEAVLDVALATGAALMSAEAAVTGNFMEAKKFWGEAKGYYANALTATDQAIEAANKFDEGVEKSEKALLAEAQAALAAGVASDMHGKAANGRRARRYPGREVQARAGGAGRPGLARKRGARLDRAPNPEPDG